MAGDSFHNVIQSAIIDGTFTLSKDTPQLVGVEEALQAWLGCDQLRLTGCTVRASDDAPTMLRLTGILSGTGPVWQGLLDGQAAVLDLVAASETDSGHLTLYVGCLEDWSLEDVCALPQESGLSLALTALDFPKDRTVLVFHSGPGGLLPAEARPADTDLGFPEDKGDLSDPLAAHLIESPVDSEADTGGELGWFLPLQTGISTFSGWNPLVPLQQSALTQLLALPESSETETLMPVRVQLLDPDGPPLRLALSVGGHLFALHGPLGDRKTSAASTSGEATRDEGAESLLQLHYAELIFASELADDPYPGMALTARAYMRALGTELLFETDCSIPSRALTLTASTLTPIDLNDWLEQAAHLFGTDESVPEIPEGLPHLLNLDRLSLTVSPAGLQRLGAAISLSADSSDTWTPDGPKLPETMKGDGPLFAIDNLALALEWSAGGRFAMSVGGRFQFLGYTLELSYAHPQGTFRGRLAPDQDTAKKLEELLGADGLGLPAELASGGAAVLTAASLDVLYEIPDQYLEVRIASADSWTIADVLTLASIELRLHFGERNFTLGELFADLDLAIGQKEVDGTRRPVRISLDAEYQPSQTLTDGTVVPGHWAFDGETGRGQPIAVGEALAGLLEQLKVPATELPEAIRELALENVRVALDSRGNAELQLDVTLPLDGGQAGLRVHVKREAEAEGSHWQVFGTLFLGPGLAFSVIFDTGPEAGSTLLANYSGDLRLRTSSLVGHLSREVGDNLPIDPELHLKGVLVAYHRETASASDKGATSGGTGSTTSGSGTAADSSTKPQAAFLFRVLLDMNIDLSSLPLVGEMLPNGLGIKAFQVIAANRAWAEEEIGTLNRLLASAEGGPPPLSAPPRAAADTPPVQKGLTLAADLELGPIKSSLFVNVGGGPKGALPPGSSTGPEASGGSGSTSDGSLPSASAPVAASGPRGRTQLQKSFGPVHLSSVGLSFKDDRLGIKLSGGLSLGPLTLDVMGLELSNPLDRFDPAFDLEGLGLSFVRGPLEIAGAFLRKTYDEGLPTEYDEYAGMLQVRFKLIELTAFGAYAKYQGHPSLFLYGFLGAPLGGPPFFFLTGLALGFGINRNFIPPPVSKVLEFPLVKVAAPQVESATDVTRPGLNREGVAEMMEQLHHHLPPQVGSYFAMAGIRFRTFGMLETLAMVAIKFGRDLEVTVLGVSTLTLPPRSPQPTVLLELQLLIRFVPAEGYLLAAGQLSNRSFALLRDIHLSGGFAAAFWFDGPHAGDFVVSIGGYHPKFKVPRHYPQQIPRLGLNWQVSRQVSVKGELYLAVTPQALMLGGLLDARADFGIVNFFIKIYADFIIYWKPFSFDARVKVEAGGHFHLDLWLCSIDIDFNLSLDVHLWGPELQGVASLKVHGKLFSVAFGKASSSKPKPLGWGEFHTAFLPEENSTVAITGGLLETPPESAEEGASARVPLINRKELELTLDSVAPTGGSFGIFPMDRQAVSANMEWAVRDGGGTLVTDHFRAVAITKPVPWALWANEKFRALPVDDLPAEATVEVQSGYRLLPNREPVGNQSESFDKQKVRVNWDRYDHVFQFCEAPAASFPPPPELKHGERATYDALHMAEKDGVRRGLSDALAELTGMTGADEDLADFKDKAAFNHINLPASGAFGKAA